MKYITILVCLLSACSHTPDLSCNIVHETKQGCPQGYQRESKPRFTEKDGSKQFACVSQDKSKEQCVDVLKPGESVNMEFHIRIDEKDNEEITSPIAKN
jgi:hypothetical protein